jgi:hypothetical protein
MRKWQNSDRRQVLEGAVGCKRTLPEHRTARPPNPIHEEQKRLLFERHFGDALRQAARQMRSEGCHMPRADRHQAQDGLVFQCLHSVVWVFLEHVHYAVFTRLAVIAKCKTFLERPIIAKCKTISEIYFHPNIHLNSTHWHSFSIEGNTNCDTYSLYLFIRTRTPCI